MYDWMKVLENNSITVEQKLEYLEEAAFNDHVKSILREEVGE